MDSPAKTQSRHMGLSLPKSKALATQLVSEFQPKQIVLLSGGLGAGKTQWVQFFLQAMGCEPSPSPTYPVINQVTGSTKPVFHVDLYRLETADEVESVGFWELFEAEEGTVFIEWPERIQRKDLPGGWSQCLLEIENGSADDLRNVQVSFF